MYLIYRSLTTFGGSECVDSITIAVDMVQKMLEVAEGRNQLQSKFNLCDPLQDDDDEYFQSTIYDPIAETVQYNRDYRGFEGATGL